MYQAEQPQRFVDAQLQHPDAADDAENNGGPQTGVFGNQADIGLAVAHIQVKRGGQGGGHAVAEFVKENEGQHHQGLPNTFAAEEFVERLDHGLAQGFGRGIGQLGLVGQKQGHKQAGQHE